MQPSNRSRSRWPLVAAGFAAAAIGWTVADVATAATPTPPRQWLGQLYPEMAPLSWESRVQLADDIVQGTIVSREVDFDARPFPVTRYALDVDLAVRSELHGTI